MPRDYENPDFFIVKVPDKRFYSFVPRVAYVGHTISLAETKHSVYQRTELEFCFRLSSAEQYAEHSRRKVPKVPIYKAFSDDGIE